MAVDKKKKVAGSKRKQTANKVSKTGRVKARADRATKAKAKKTPAIGPGSKGGESLTRGELRRGNKRLGKAIAKSQGKSGKEARKAGRDNAKAAVKGDKAKGKAIYKAARDTKKAYKKNPTAANAQKLKTAKKAKSDRKDSKTKAAHKRFG